MSRTKYYTRSPGFIVDPNSMHRNYGKQIDWANVPDSFRSTAFTVICSANALAAATTLNVDPLAGNIPAGTTLHFGTGKFARLTVEAMEGDTSLTVEALVNNIDDTDEATYGGDGKKSIPAGTIVAELASGKVIPRSAVTGAETSIGILQTSAIQDDKTGKDMGYSVLVGAVVYENLLPDYADTNYATWKGELHTAGTATGWSWQMFSDNT